MGRVEDPVGAQEHRISKGPLSETIISRVGRMGRSLFRGMAIGVI
jgi:hypothetical protein